MFSCWELLVTRPHTLIARRRIQLFAREVLDFTCSWRGKELHCLCQPHQVRVLTEKMSDLPEAHRYVCSSQRMSWCFGRTPSAWQTLSEHAEHAFLAPKGYSNASTSIVATTTADGHCRTITATNRTINKYGASPIGLVCMLVKHLSDNF